MTFLAKTIAMVAIATLAIKIHDCEAYSACNITVKEQTQGRVELIELMLPRHTRGSDSKKAVSGDEPRYEIFIKQNKNARDPIGTSKIKIFVESDDYGSEKPSSKHHNRTSPNFHSEDKNNRVVPLAIQSGGLNADRNTDKDNSDNRSSYASDSYKGQVYLVNSYINNASVVDELETKNTYRTDKPVRQHDAQTMKDARSQTKPHESNSTSRQNDNREQKIGRKNKNTGEDDLFLLSKSGEAFQLNDSHKRTIRENTSRIREPDVYKASDQRPLLSANSPRISDTESHHVQYHHRHEPTFENLPSPYHKDDTIPSVGKQLVYEPDRGISATETNSYNAKRFAEHPGTSTGNAGNYRGRELSQAEDDEYGETVTSSHRRPLTEDIGRRPVREEPISDRNSYRSDGYSNARSHSANGYARDGSSYREGSSGDERRRADSSFSSDRKGSYGSETHDHSRDSSVVSNTELPHQVVPNSEQVTRYETTTKRPAGQKDYYGFPESYTSTMYEASRPTSYEGPSALPGSSCPSVFKYVEYGDNRWYADVYVSTDETLFGMRLDVILSKRADLLTALAAEVKSTDNIRFMILSLKKKLMPGSPEVVRIMVKYNVNERAPFVKTISLNGRQICPPGTKTTKRPNLIYPIDVIEQKRTTERVPEMYTRPPTVNEYPRTTAKPTNFKRTTPSMSFLPEPNPDAYESPDYSTPNRQTTPRPGSIHQTFTNRPASPVLSNSDNRRPDESINGGNDNYNNYGGSLVPNKPSHDRKPTVGGKKVECGLPAIQPAPLITNGQNTARGQWPWHAALYKNIVPNLTYSCGGSLVTNLHVITAAHCVTSEYSSIPLDPKILLVYLGKYHLYVSTENGIAAKGVSRVTVHPNYNVTDFRSDIAVLTLSSRVEFTDLIRPVCLWDKRNTRIEDIVGLQGTVVGWGYDDSKQLTKELKQANMPVVKHNECLWSYPDFYPKFTSNATYCAGFKNGTSVCNGDSGGGMVFPIKVNREERWFLRGLVSLSPGLKDMRVCDTHHYVVFTDVAKYLPWLEDIIS